MPNPEAIPPVKASHIRTLENMQSYRLARIATDPEHRGHTWTRQEAHVLGVAIAELKEIYAKRCANEPA